MNVTFDVIRWAYQNTSIKMMLRYIRRFSSTSTQTSGDSTKAGQAQIHHSDRGMQYASFDYTERLKVIGAVMSMSATGNSYENAKAESFFKTLKQEEVYLKEYQSFADAEANLTLFIEQMYNVKRLHSSLGYHPPAEFEASYASLSRS